MERAAIIATAPFYSVLSAFNSLLLLHQALPLLSALTLGADEGINADSGCFFAWGNLAFWASGPIRAETAGRPYFYFRYTALSLDSLASTATRAISARCSNT
jgi:hypothetical protein